MIIDFYRHLTVFDTQGTLIMFILYQAKRVQLSVKKEIINIDNDCYDYRQVELIHGQLLWGAINMNYGVLPT